MAQESPYLSVVAVSRNDEHGGNTLERTQIFVDTFLDQCARHELSAELILVEWNPPGERLPLAEVVSWGRGNEWVDCRVVTVPWERHRMMNYGRKLPLYQMIGKNVGIRRARGKFVLTTNIDILLSAELFAVLASQELRADRMYRVDRFDIDKKVPMGTVDEKMDYAWANVIRRNVRSTPEQMAELQQADAPMGEVLAVADKSGFFDRERIGDVDALVSKSDVPQEIIHLLMCGDFTLLHRDGWARMGGYAELDLYSLHIDSLGVHCGHRAGYRETWLAPPAVCFHVEHDVGSGYTLQQAGSLFDRLSEQGIGWFDYEDMLPWFERMEAEGSALEFNGPEWGMRDIPLRETRCLANRRDVAEVPRDQEAPWDAPVAAFRDEFELTGHFRRIRKSLEAQVAGKQADFRAYVEESERSQRETRERWETERGAVREKIKEVNAKLGKVRSESSETQKELQAELGRLRGQVDEMATKLRRTREQLGGYRRVFGGLERLGLFR